MGTITEMCGPTCVGSLVASGARVTNARGARKREASAGAIGENSLREADRERGTGTCMATDMGAADSGVCAQANVALLSSAAVSSLRRLEVWPLEHELTADG